MKRIVRAALAGAIGCAAFIGWFDSWAVTPSRSSAPTALDGMHIPTAPHGPITQQMIRNAEETGVVDLYGNEVSSAVATYTFDDLGALYEVHSPQTEVPLLGSPKS